MKSKIIKTKTFGIIASPVVYSLFVPLLILDLWIMFYQWVCFHVYGIPTCKRRDFIAYDRNLDYLTGLEKINCQYCGYANGLFALFKEVGANSEAYWCPIKHSRKLEARHSKYESFADHGDIETYRKLTEGK